MPAGAPEPGVARVVYLLRHGEPVGGVRYRGWTDDPLCARGHEQMRRAIGGLGRVDGIVTSPLRRCADFARALAAERGLPLIVEPGFRELFFGRWEGRTPSELIAGDRGSLARFWSDPVAHPPPEGERFHDFSARVLAAWRALVAAHGSGTLLCIVHGGTVRVVLGWERRLSLEGLLRLDVPYASVHRVIPGVHGVE